MSDEKKNLSPSRAVMLLMSLLFAVTSFVITMSTADSDMAARVLGAVSAPFVMSAIIVAIYRLIKKTQNNNFISQFSLLAFIITVLTVVSRLNRFMQ